jgi:ribosomal protein S18 acetylase RimI-like enzyme
MLEIQTEILHCRSPSPALRNHRLPDFASSSERAVACLPVTSIGRIDIRPAARDDVDVVLELLAEAAEWTASIGFANWPARFPRAVVTHGIADRKLYVVHERDAIVATLALQWRDVMFWGERDGDAGYVHRLVVRRDRAGAGLGATILDWAAEQVNEAGREWLRLDVPTDNVALCAYYERLGFEYRGDAEGELSQPDGVVRRWRSRLYERGCGSR